MCQEKDGNKFPNNFCYYTSTSDLRYNAYFGFTLQEVKALLDENHLDVVADNLGVLEENSFTVDGDILYSQPVVMAYIESKLNVLPNKLTVFLGNPWDKDTRSSTSDNLLIAECRTNII